MTLCYRSVMVTLVARRASPRLRSLADSERGATAIEYGLIAGLIALGLVGSLVTTRGSLAAIFGVASSQMGTASSQIGAAAPANASNTQAAAYWSAKTLTRRALGATATVFTYSDGSVVTLTRDSNVNFPTRISAMDSASHVRTILYLDPNGVPGSGSYTQFAADDTTLQASYFANSGFWSNGVPTSEVVNVYNSTGNLTSQTTIAPTAQYLAQMATAGDVMAYFLKQ